MYRSSMLKGGFNMNIRKELSKGSSSLLVLSVPRMCMAIGCIWD